MYGAQEQRDFATAFPSFPETWRLALLRYELPLHATFEENAAFQAELVRKMRAAKAANRLYYGPKPKNQD